MHTMAAKLVGAARFSYCFLAKPAEGITGFKISDMI